MASFVESATLELVDETTGTVKKVNAALRSLEATSKKVAAALRRIDFGISNVDAGIRKLNQLDAAMSRVAKNRISPTVQINTGNAMRSLNALNSAVARAAGKTISPKISLSTAQARRSLASLNSVVITPKINLPNVAGQLNALTIKPKIDKSAFSGIGHAIGTEIREEVVNALVEGIKSAIGQGLKTLDVAETRASLLDIPDADRAKLKEISANEAAETASPFGRGQLFSIATELYSTAKRSADATAAFLDQANRLGSVMTTVGLSAQEAEDGMAKVFKVFETTGRITDAQGNVNKEGLKNATDLYIKGLAAIGKELTPELFETTLRAAQVTKTTLDDKGFLSLLFAAEELRQTAGVGTNQAIKALTGGTTNKKLANQEKYGIIDVKQINVGTIDGKTVTENTAKNANEALLRSNPFQYAAQVLIPAMKKAGLDPNNNIDASKFANDIAGDRTAVAQIANMIIRAAENEKQVEQALTLGTSQEKLDAIAAQSSMLALNKAFSDISSAAGTAASSLESIFIPVLNKIGGAAQALESFIAPEGKPDATRTGIAAGGLLGTAAAALFGGKKIVDMFTGIPANTTATWANTGALDANTAALLASAGKGVTPAVAASSTAANAAKTTGAFAFMRTALKGIGVALVTQLGLDLADAVDPGGNLFGLTKPIDDWFKRNFDFDPSQDAGKLLAPLETVTKNLVPAIKGIETLGTLAQTIYDGIRAPTEQSSVAAVNESTQAAVRDSGAVDAVVRTIITQALEAARNNQNLRLSGSDFAEPGTGSHLGKTEDDLGIGESIRTSASTARAELETAFTTGGSVVSNAVAGASTQLGGAFQTGASIVAAAIRAALATPVSVNVNTNGLSNKPLDTGSTKLTPRHN